MSNGHHPSGLSRAENALQVLILVAIGAMAGAASFTHVHDWTMDHAADGTHDWFGWANAVISELMPLAAGLEIRRRRQIGAPIGYPVALLAGSALFSLAAQVAQATPSMSGWVLAALPAIGFMALMKLVLGGRPAETIEADETVSNAPTANPSRPAADPAQSQAPAPAPAAAPARKATRKAARKTAKRDTGQAIAALLDKHPDLTQAEIAARLKVTDRTVRRYLNNLSPAEHTEPAPALAAVS
jgi:hypothetical protein